MIEIRGREVLEENETTKNLSINSRCLALKLQNDIDELIRILANKGDSVENIDYSLSYYLKKFLDNNSDLKSSYDIKIEKSLDKENNTYYEIVLIEIEKDS